MSLRYALAKFKHNLKLSMVAVVFSNLSLYKSGKLGATLSKSYLIEIQRFQYAVIEKREIISSNSVSMQNLCKASYILQ